MRVASQAHKSRIGDSGDRSLNRVRTERPNRAH